MPVDAQRVQAVFAATFDVADAADRAAILDRECGDEAELRRRVEALLRANDAPGSLLDGRTGAVQPEPDEVEDLAGTLIAGRYKLREQIGEGGMGTVWVADQNEPVKRMVALKLIKPGLDSKSVLARFEAERQALGMMDHPNIAKVFDGGFVGQASSLSQERQVGSLSYGRPFFVMEYVKGVPITQYCDRAQLTVQQRLELFLPVCHAVQHAHQKGIIHRDLKPSNILICLYDGQPVPKVIDFGLAKALHQPLTEHSLYTTHGMMIGTPLYMSPEQAEFNNLDVDTRTDIYSLGVLLYQLLTGATPLEKQRVRDAAWQEIIRLIKDDEPQKPSTRLSGSGSLPSIAAQRKIESIKLAKLIRGDLDWITMKALEKDRDRRYETANGLAMDIQRYLAEEPVLAGPPGAGYKLRKFVRRNRPKVIAASLLLLTLVAGIAGTTFGLVRAEHRRQEAEQARADESEQRQRAEANEQKALASVEAEKHAKQQAETRFAETKAVLDFVEYRVFSAAHPSWENGRPGPDVKLQDAVRKVLHFLESDFTDKPLIEARLRSTFGILFFHLGEPEAEHMFERAMDLWKNKLGPDHLGTLMSKNRLAWVLATTPNAALRDPSRAVALAKEAVEKYPDIAFFRYTLGVARYRAGDWKAAVADLETAIGMRNADDPDIAYDGIFLAMAHWQLGEKEKAREWFDKSVKIKKDDIELNRYRAEAAELLGVR